MRDPTFMLALGFFLVFFATSLGAVPPLFLSSLSKRTESALLGGSAGVMLGASIFSLLLPSLKLYQKSGSSPLQAAGYVACSFLLGALLLFYFHKLLPHEHFFKGAEGAAGDKLNRKWLVILAVALHNLPEGLAVGTGLGSQDLKIGLTLATAIALQDFPEGLIVAMGLKTMGLSMSRIITITAFTGLIESLGVLIGFGAVSVTQTMLPAAFAFCAGAMMFVVSHEVIPESHRQGFEKEATSGVMLGFVLMMFLDFGLG